ncbi:hypothetical protein Pmani_032483 [Petrolisthes manimaculis]|uniref:Uncharacterized protein n=1 Tax=Petrolisthes manimaculis TaxID=1843537 RepID=A0AAE1NT24_9EUCA|nr:hypothetical protein Pmani_032483 [Petrolisthes manimaculis]
MKVKWRNNGGVKDGMEEENRLSEEERARNQEKKGMEEENRLSEKERARNRKKKRKEFEEIGEYFMRRSKEGN